MKMKFKNFKLTPVFALRLGLGLTLIYAGVHMFLDSSSWIGFIPGWLFGIIEPQIALYLHAAFELILGLALLAGLWLPLASLLLFFNLFAILLFYGIDDVTFRDFGLLMAALALFLLSSNKQY